MSPSSVSFSRRGLFKVAALAATAGVAATTVAAAPRAAAQSGSLGAVIDYSAGVPSAAAVKEAGYLGAVRYVSEARADWMLGKPIRRAEAQDFAAHGLAVASVYQYGKDGTADWVQGATGATTHAPQAIYYHQAAGGPTGRPIYIAIDDNPSRWQYDNQIKPYLQAFSTTLRAAGYRTGIYGNYQVIDWAVADGIGEYFWMHNWGHRQDAHPEAALHQVRIDKDSVDGVGIDINYVYREDWGQWTPGQSDASLSALLPELDFSLLNQLSS